MAHTHAAHDCVLGDRCVIANNTHIGGHVTVGEQVWFGGAVAVHQWCRIGDHAFVGGGAILVADVIPFGSVVGNHAHLAGLNVVGLKRRTMNVSVDSEAYKESQTSTYLGFRFGWTF